MLADSDAWLIPLPALAVHIQLIQKLLRQQKSFLQDRQVGSTNTQALFPLEGNLEEAYPNLNLVYLFP